MLIQSSKYHYYCSDSMEWDQCFSFKVSFPFSCFITPHSFAQLFSQLFCWVLSWTLFPYPEVYFHERFINWINVSSPVNLNTQISFPRSSFKNQIPLAPLTSFCGLPLAIQCFMQSYPFSYRQHKQNISKVIDGPKNLLPKGLK